MWRIGADSVAWYHLLSDDGATFSVQGGQSVPKRKTPYDKVKKHMTLPRWFVDQVNERRTASNSAFGSQIANDARRLDCYNPPKAKKRSR